MEATPSSSEESWGVNAGNGSRTAQRDEPQSQLSLDTFGRLFSLTQTHTSASMHPLSNWAKSSGRRPGGDLIPNTGQSPIRPSIFCLADKTSAMHSGWFTSNLPNRLSWPAALEPLFISQIKAELFGPLSPPPHVCLCVDITCRSREMPFLVAPMVKRPPLLHLNRAGGGRAERRTGGRGRGWARVADALGIL